MLGEGIEEGLQNELAMGIREKQKRIGDAHRSPGIDRLSDMADHGIHRGQRDEEVEIGKQGVQVPCSLHFGSSDLQPVVERGIDEQ